MGLATHLAVIGLVVCVPVGRAAPVTKERPAGGYILAWSDAKPVLFTPDGATVAELGHEDYGGKPGSAVLSPDGKRCVIALEDGWVNVTRDSLRKKYRLVVREVAGKTAGTKVEFDADVVPSGAFWSRDGKRVIATVYTLDALRAAEAAKKPSAEADREYREVHPATGKVGERVAGLAGAEQLYDVRADGTCLVRVPKTGFVTLSADGKTRTGLTANYPKGCWPNVRAVSPDGTKVLHNDLRKTDPPKGQFGVLDLSTGNHTQLTVPDWPVGETRQVFDCDWSPDGKRFVFTVQTTRPDFAAVRGPQPDYSAAVYMADLDGKNLKLVRKVESNGGMVSLSWR